MPASWSWHGWQVLLWACLLHVITEKLGLQSTCGERNSGFDYTRFQFYENCVKKLDLFLQRVHLQNDPAFWCCCHQQRLLIRFLLGSQSSSHLSPSSWCSDLKDSIRSIRHPFKLIHIQSLDYFASSALSSNLQVDCSGQSQALGKQNDCSYTQKNYHVH